MLIAEDIMPLYVRNNPSAFSVPDRFRSRCGCVEQILDPFLRSERRAQIVFWIFRFVEPHLLYDQPHLVHAAGGILPAELVESNATVFGDPLCRVTRVPVGRGFRKASFVDEDQRVANSKIVVPAEQHFARTAQAERGASKLFANRKAKHEKK